ncbi:MAG: hypothetical protein KatS3mg035_0215 [Bacteroidia bacterium]|nr:MAG: hypothetical protein KatS3mg035_0215 [Bacteroidia bacterium]
MLQDNFHNQRSAHLPVVAIYDIYEIKKYLLTVFPDRINYILTNE